MDTSVLKNFAQESRRYLLDVVRKKIDYYLTTDNADIRAKKALIADLKKDIADTSKDQVVEKIAYTWFNRFCALRYMDVKQYSVVGVLTPASSEHTQPEILMEAKSGQIKEELGRKENRDQVIALLSGKVSSSDSQSDAYKLLLLMACNYYHSIMPFLFEKVDDYTELLMPDDLLSEASIISRVRSALSVENCENVEVIGWLYQFYISEKKDEVFADLKNNKKITPENIPAATQLFTPNWIVRYLVENSLGRLWMLNRPNSNLISKMEYYIKLESEETDFLKIKGPEEIKICDPACGSGHMLVYAFDLLCLIYEEEGIDPNEIPSQILKNNLFGIEIDERAGELAAFALTMKAREKLRRYFRNPIQPNICVLDNIHFEANEIKEYMDHIGRDLFTEKFQNTLYQFEEAKNFGSLIKPELTDVDNILSLLDKKNVSEHLFLTQTHSKVLRILSQVSYLSPIYHVIIANPPYMGNGGMNNVLKDFLSEKFADSKSDLMTSFIERCILLVKDNGNIGMITLPSWLFIATYERLRIKLINNFFISSLLHLGRGVFGSDFGSVAFVIKKAVDLPEDSKGAFYRLFDEHVQVRSNNEIKVKFLTQKEQPFLVSQISFLDVPKVPIAYWMSNLFLKTFKKEKLKKIFLTREGMATADNARFLRQWFEVSFNTLNVDAESELDAIQSQKKWFPYTKGGSYRKWYGNNELVVEYFNGGQNIKNNIDINTGRVRSHNYNGEYAFKEGLTWTALTAGSFSARYSKKGFLFDSKGPKGFSNNPYFVLGLLNSVLGTEYLKVLAPTLDFKVGDLLEIPLCSLQRKQEIETLVVKAIEISKDDWDSYELSWDFNASWFKKLLTENLLEKSVDQFIERNKKNFLTLKEIEENLNQIFIDEYKLKDELNSSVENSEIALFRNTFLSSYKSDKLTIAKEIINYSVGCMFGRYSLDVEGLILANQGESIKDYLKHVPNPSFTPDEDNVIPLLDGDWFTDEISERFKKFIKVVFGENNIEQNLKFIEDAIGKNIRRYFEKDFYNDHVKMYKKRPIYWMFSSPNGTFNALIYMHRYTSDTVSIVLNSYLREFRAKLASKRENLERLSADASASARDKTAAVKEIEQLKKMIVELDEYEKDILYPLATQRLAIDLDDGVKVNYPKFGKALKPIKGLDKDED
ncbi:MAG: BREX-1 system adenine-specific DNA-methyltransferase PglX [Bacteriovoracaceae bacterium]